MDNSNSSLGKVVTSSNACSSCEFANQYRPMQKNVSTKSETSAVYRKTICKQEMMTWHQ